MKNTCGNKYSILEKAKPLSKKEQKKKEMEELDALLGGTPVATPAT